jgi:hypothetical protein
MKNKSMFKTSLLAAVLAAATSAYAVPTITVFDGTTTVVIADGSVIPGAVDLSAAAGIVNWSGSIGLWDILFETGFTKPVFGSATNPFMDLKFGAGNTGGVQSPLTIDFSENGFSFSGGLIDSWGGTTPGTVTNQLLINGRVVITQGPLTPGTPNDFSSAAGANVTLVPTDVVTLRVIVSHTGPQQLTTGNKNVRTPDGGSTVALLGLALGGVAAARRKFRF